MKYIPLILLVSLSVLTACQDEPIQEKAEVAKTAVVVEAPAKVEQLGVEKELEAAPVAKVVETPKGVEAPKVAEAPKTTEAPKAEDEDEESGVALHKANCARCHEDDFYAKPDSRMKDYAGLHKMVGMCDAQLGTELFPEELVKITDHLNASFYKFAK